MTVFRALCAFALVALTACASTKCPPDGRQTPPPIAAAAPVTHVAKANVRPGFYRHADEPTVYKIDEAGHACVVVSVPQMDAFGGFAKVHVVPHALDFLGGLPSAPACPWPKGR
jgi:hypothetical protein